MRERGRVGVREDSVAAVPVVEVEVVWGAREELGLGLEGDGSGCGCPGLSSTAFALDASGPEPPRLEDSASTSVSFEALPPSGSPLPSILRTANSLSSLFR